ncbi:MAG: hypothetical protein RIM99_07500 [Cyclobacteriaceae bacterium]
MGDQLEQFIIKNKESFNDETPSEKVWREIDKKMRRQNRFLQIAWKVAAVLFMVSTIYLLVDRTNSENFEGAQLSNEFQQAEDYYTQMISMKRTEIQEKLTPEQQSEFLQEIDQLDELYTELKKTYQTNAASDRVLDAMVSNLQLRLNILNKQLEILENFKDQNDESEPNIEI